jgi:hypothetical protein
MSEELLAALKRIRMVAHYGLEEHAPRGALEYIIEEVTEAINNAKEQDQ